MGPGVLYCAIDLDRTLAMLPKSSISRATCRSALEMAGLKVMADGDWSMGQRGEATARMVKDVGRPKLVVVAGVPSRRISAAGFFSMAGFSIV